MNKNIGPYLQDELLRRIRKNPRYSLRSFAKAIGMNSGSLSRILSGQVVPSQRTTLKIAESLGVEIVTVLLPMQIMTSFGRVVSPITPAIIAIAGMAGVSPLQVVKRTAIPMLVAALVNVGFMVYNLSGM